MSLRAKAFVVLVLFAVLLTALTAAILQRYVTPGIEALEREAAVRQVQQVVRAVEREAAGLAAQSSDWSSWQDTLEFVQRPGPAFVHEDLVYDSFEANDFNLFALYDADTNLLWGRVFDFAGASDIMVPEALLRADSGEPGAPSRGLGYAGLAGIFDSGRGPGLIDARPIVGLDGTLAGLLVIAKVLDDPTVESIGRLTEVNFEILPFAALDPQVKLQLAAAAAGAAFAVAPEGEGGLRIEVPLVDIFGAKVFAVRARLPLALMPGAKKTLGAALTAAVAAAAALLLVSLVLLEFLVLRPLSTLRRRLGAVAVTEDPEARIDLPRDDEVGALAAAMDAILARRAAAPAAEADEVAAAMKRILHDARNALLPVVTRVDSLIENNRGAETAEMARALQELASTALEPDRRAKLIDYLKLKVADIGERQNATVAELEALSKRVAKLDARLSPPRGRS
jgi:sensor domain CHASE-containing protein